MGVKPSYDYFSACREFVSIPDLVDSCKQTEYDLVDHLFGAPYVEPDGCVQKMPIWK